MNLLDSKRVLVVEDTTIAATYLARELTKMGADVVGIARSEQQAVAMAADLKPELIMMDIHLAEGGSGISAAQQISENHHIPLIYTTSFSDDATLGRALETAPYGYIVKPFDAKAIKVCCETALKRFALEQSMTGTEERFKVAAEAAHCGITDLHETGSHFMFSGVESFRHRLGAATDIPYPVFLTLFDPSDRAQVESQLSTNTSFRQNLPLLDGSKNAWLDVIFSDIQIVDGVVKIGAIVDVTEKPRSQRKLQLSNVILEHLAEAVAIIDSNCNLVKASAAFLRFLGQPDSVVEGENLLDHPITKSLFASFTLQGTPTIQRHKVSLDVDDGASFDAFVTLTPLVQWDTSTQWVITVSDFSGLASAEQKLEQMAFTDPLTGAGNRNYLKLVLNESLFTAGIQSLLFLDLDGFKQVNDSYGHDVGDALLKVCAKRIKAVIRDSDSLVRHGGDEFIVLVQHSADTSMLAERILQAVNKPATCKNIPVTVSASIGIADAALGNSAEALLRHADVAMYEAKSQGKNKVVTYTPGHSEAVEYRLFVEQGLYDAILKKDLYASFQPIVNLNGDVCGLEALCRWRGEDVVDISPDIFIPVAEESGLINALGLKMLREVCIARALLAEKGFGHIKIHVNVSLLQLATPSLVEQFVTYLADFNIPASAIVIEVKEQSLCDPGAKRVVNALVDTGFNVALDNFGRGQVDVSALLDNSVSIVKFDGSVFERLESEKNKILIQTLVGLCKKLGKTVIFGGVETQEQGRFAKELGSDYLQGFLYGEAKSLTESMQIVSGKQIAMQP
ncbi:EAL domain-containing protein [Alteromonas sp. C1M14]|uniref:two-component system response regulator n=1 Tax=Alteromonas sp. C1M14 TaxID=2841567 RepID=UPI001C09747D|nr:EAL domain-containing protein [Alteromonas sp. C1M14]MBU2978966.1 EAL domain-containing protein [Alteromonas sp. C1M14]